MLDESQSFLIGKIRRQLAGVRIEVHAVDEAGRVEAAWGVYVQQEMEVDPFALRRDLNQLADVDGAVVHQIEERSAFSAHEVAQFIIETTPAALYGAAITKGVDAIVAWLKQRAHRPSGSGQPNVPATPEVVLAEALRRAEHLARQTYDLHFDVLTVASHSLSEPADPNDATAMIVFKAQDGSVISVHLWVAEGETRHTISRVMR
ncbi:hypothetical protein FHT44_002326 [Mycolicibacterium sp. BK634]|uniref:hypothetical protein n=1 Tax=Mycolicibacterium sp. BK634 TaxID=2587099 RepID=UPI00160AA302|nr:hypothetical protein [Mycolicibacterium sp. BK634]MBB3749865.1 hypothetical protein [Mycolicibacterium sp. BK634]